MNLLKIGHNPFNKSVFEMPLFKTVCSYGELLITCLKLKGENYLGLGETDLLSLRWFISISAFYRKGEGTWRGSVLFMVCPTVPQLFSMSSNNVHSVLDSLWADWPRSTDCYCLLLGSFLGLLW